MVEQADTIKEQDGHQVDMDFIKQPRLEALLHDVRRGNNNVLVASGSSQMTFALRTLI